MRFERGGGDYGVNSSMRFEFIQNGLEHHVVTRRVCIHEGSYNGITTVEHSYLNCDESISVMESLPVQGDRIKVVVLSM